MCYRNAKDLLPEEILDLVQQFVNGESIYIPIRNGNRSNWGAKNNTKNVILVRNLSIYSDFQSGISRKVLSEKYFLSKKSIDRIILNEKSKL